MATPRHVAQSSEDLSPAYKDPPFIIILLMVISY